MSRAKRPAASMAEDEVYVFEFTPAPELLGEPLIGDIYITTLVCPGCGAMLISRGVAYPLCKCSGCGLILEPRDKYLEDDLEPEDDR